MTEQKHDDSEWELFSLFNEILYKGRLYFSISYLNDICKKLDLNLAAQYVTELKII